MKIKSTYMLITNVSNTVVQCLCSISIIVDCKLVSRSLTALFSTNKGDYPRPTGVIVDYEPPVLTIVFQVSLSQLGFLPSTWFMVKCPSCQPTVSKYWKKSSAMSVFQMHYHTVILRCQSVNVDAFTTTCCDLDLWPPKYNQVISSG